MLKEMNENLLLFSSRYLKQKDYWTNKLSGNVTGAGIFPAHRDEYTISRVPQVPGKAGIIFPAHLCGRILKLSKNSNLSLYIVLLSGLKSLIYRYSGEKDILVLSPVNKLKVSEETINNQVPIYDAIDGDISFKGLLFKIRQSVLEAYENQDYPFDKLAEHLFAVSPLNNEGNTIACVLKNIHHPTDIEEQGRLLVFTFEKEGDRVSGMVTYDTAAYESRFIRQMSRHFIKTLESCLDNIDIKISEISFLSEEEKKRLLLDFNNTRAEYPGDKTIHELFAVQAAKTADRIASVCKDSHITYSRLNKKADQLARVLREKGVKADTIVGIQLERSLEMIIGILGILKAGGAYLPIDPDYPRERIDFMLKDSGAKILLKDLSEGHHIDFPASPLPRFLASQPSNLAYVIYTSGTTGSPRGVMLEHRSVVNYTWWAINMYIRDERMDFPLYTSISFDLTVTSIFAPLLSGNAVVVYRGDNGITQIEKIIDENRVGIVKLTPSHLKLLRHKKMNGSKGPGTTIRRFILGGENLESRLAADICGNFRGNIEIYNEYGPTEAAVGCMIYKFAPGDIKSRFVPIGKPAANTGIYILDERQNPVPPGGTGELCVSGAGVSRGYLNQPELTEEKFLTAKTREDTRSLHLTHPLTHSPYSPIYKTGDLARWLPDGNIECSGRKDNQVKIRGYRVELGEVENRLQMHEKISEAVVLAKEESLCAYIVGDSQLNASQLREYLSTYLPHYMIPSYFVPMDRMPLTVNGKLDLESLPEPGPGLDRERFLAPRDEVEDKLADIWSKVLGIEKHIIGIDANFFEMGGHSLKATILMSRIHKEFSVKISLEEIFNIPTIRQLSGYIERAVAERYLTIDPAEKSEYCPVSLQQNRFYILQQIDLQSTAYNIPNAYILAGNLDGKKLEATFKNLIRRHESLRTSFQIMNKEPVQKISDEVEFEIEYYDRELPSVSNFIRPFDLSRAPLLRVGLAETGTNEYLLLMDMHHIITDGISIGLMAKEFMALYGGEELPPLRLQYKEYSRWQNSERQREAIKQQREYWLGQFPSEVPVLRLPTDFPRPEIQSFEGNEIDFEIGQEETSALKKLASEQGVTLFMVLLAAYNVLLSKLSTQEDIVVGTAAASRGHEDLKNIIGLFFNTLPVRNYPSGQKKFNDFLQDVKKRTLEVFDNQDYPYDHLVRELTERKLLKRDAGRNPLFDTMFGLQNFEAQAEDIPEVEIPGLKLKIHKYENKTAKFDLFFIAKEIGEIIFVTLEYASALFKRSTVEKIIDLYIDVIRQVTENSNIRLKEVKIPTEFQEVKSRFKTEEYQNFGF